MLFLANFEGLNPNLVISQKMSYLGNVVFALHFPRNSPNHRENQLPPPLKLYFRKWFLYYTEFMTSSIVIEDMIHPHPVGTI